jgi:hypothetical protein
MCYSSQVYGSLTSAARDDDFNIFRFQKAIRENRSLFHLRKTSFTRLNSVLVFSDITVLFYAVPYNTVILKGTEMTILRLEEEPINLQLQGY